MTARSYSKDEVERKGNFIKTLITAPFVVFSVLFITLIFSIIVEFIGMSFIWTEQGVMHSRLMVAEERDYLSKQVGDTIYGKSPDLLAENSTRWVRSLLNQLGVNSFIASMERPARPGDSAPMAGLRDIYAATKDYIFAAILMIELFALRLVVVTLSIPVFVLYGTGAVIDGLVQRDLRKFGGGNESSWLYHKVKRCLKPLIAISIFTYLSSPMSMHPNFVFVPGALMFGLFLFLTVSTFKKTV